MNRNVEEAVYGMLVENTGRALGDSGGAYGRHWERNQGKSLEDFKAEPAVSYDLDGAKDSEGIDFTVSVYHYLTSGGLELDDVCEAFNRLNVDAEDWDGEYYGVSKRAQAFLDKLQFEEKESWNTYNGSSSLSQTLQGTYVKQPGSVDTYVLLQVHGGCDVRGGYTNARMFLLPDDYMPSEDVSGTINGIGVNSGWNGYSLTSEGGDGEPEQGGPVPLRGNGQDVIELSIG